MNAEHSKKLRELYHVFPESFWMRLFATLEEKVVEMQAEAEEGAENVSTYCAFMNLLELEAAKKASVRRDKAHCLTNDELTWLLRPAKSKGLST